MTDENDTPAAVPPPAEPAGTGTPGAAEGASERALRAELGIGGGAANVDVDQAMIDRLLGEAVIGYEEVFKGTALDAEGAAAAPSPGGGAADAGSQQVIDQNLKLLRDVNLKVKVELGRGHMYLKDILTLGQGSVVELERLAGDPLDIYVNDKVIARGEVLVLNENFCIRVTEIYNPAEALALGG